MPKKSLPLSAGVFLLFAYKENRLRFSVYANKKKGGVKTPPYKTKKNGRLKVLSGWRF